MSGSSNRLIPANTTLLQPGTRFFRISDALNYQQQTASTAGATTTAQIASINTQITTMNSQISTIQGQITTINSTLTSLQNQINMINTTTSNLQSQIDTINSRLATAGIP